MRKVAFFGFLSLIILNCHSCKITESKNGKYPPDEKPHPVEELYLSSIEAFNKRDLELFLANFAPEIRMYGTDGNYFGQNALRKRFEVLFAQFPNARMEIPELNLEVLSEEVVMVNFKWKVFPMGQGPAFSGIGSGIYKKTNEKWVEILEAERITEVDEALRKE